MISAGSWFRVGNCDVTSPSRRGRAVSSGEGFERYKQTTTRSNMARIRLPVSRLTKHARDLRERQTKAESLLWDVIRAKQLCGLKFRRQHPIDPFVADFACTKLQTIVEIDGGYHDYHYENDKVRQQYLEKRGWRVIRFSNEEVLEDVDAVSIAIARLLDQEYEFKRRSENKSGMASPNAPGDQANRKAK